MDGADYDDSEGIINKYHNIRYPYSDALTFESSNYNARVFLAVAKLNLGKHEESEQAYQTAIGNQPETLLAWQASTSTTHISLVSLLMPHVYRAWQASTKSYTNGLNT